MTSLRNIELKLVVKLQTFGTERDISYIVVPLFWLVRGRQSRK